MQVGASIAGTLTAQRTRCPLCSQPVAPDRLGFIECGCGWGGQDDPLETARGLSRAITIWDRRRAGAQTRRELARIAAKGVQANNSSALYLLLLTMAATVVYLALISGPVLSVYGTVYYLLGRAWLGVAICALAAGAIAVSLWHPRRHLRGPYMPLSRYPRLAAAMEEVASRVGAKPPSYVVSTPDANFSVYAIRRLRRGLRREVVVTIGAASLTLLSEAEVKAILAHELAHHQHGDTFISSYVGAALASMRYLIALASVGVESQQRVVARGKRYRRHGDAVTGMDMLAYVVTWTLLLPFRLCWAALHLMALHESRVHEYAADAAAIYAYGAPSFIAGLTGVNVVMRTLHSSRAGIRQEMGKHGERNFYAELRRHYAELPPELLHSLRLSASQRFRSLENTHPTVADRLRAALLLPPSPLPPLGQTVLGSYLIVPEGAADASEAELALSAKI